MFNAFTRASSKVTSHLGRFARPVGNAVRSQARASTKSAANNHAPASAPFAPESAHFGQLAQGFDLVTKPVRTLVHSFVYRPTVLPVLFAGGVFYATQRETKIYCDFNEGFGIKGLASLVSPKSNPDVKSPWGLLFSSIPRKSEETSTDSQLSCADSDSMNQDIDYASSSTDISDIQSVDEIVRENENLKAELAKMKERCILIMREHSSSAELVASLKEQLFAKEKEINKLSTENRGLKRKHERVQESLEEYTSLITCKVCHHNTVSEFYTTCGHACVCNDCAIQMLHNEIHDCPLCRSPNANYLRQRIVFA